MSQILDFLSEKIGMSGWVTWFASTGLVVAGLIKVFKGDFDTGMMIISLAMGLVGLGRKHEKIKGDIDNIKNKLEEPESELRDWKK